MPSESVLDFGEVYVGGTAVRSVDLVVASGASLNVDELRIVDDDCYHATSQYLTQAQSGDTLTLTVLFQPTAAQSYVGHLLILYSNQLEVDIELSGIGVSLPDCDDANVCTDDAYDLEAASCQYVHNSGACDDGDLCTGNDECVDGVCFGFENTCDDGIGCTLDQCQPETGECGHIPVHAECHKSDCSLPTCDPFYGCLQEAFPDGSTCGAVTACFGAICIGGECLTQDLLDGMQCDDDSCTGSGVCLDGECLCGSPPVPPDCDDANACTADSYDEATDRCLNINRTGPCDDGSPCTQDDSCEGGYCRGVLTTCDDSVDCTQDFCNIATGECLNIPDHTACDAEICEVSACDAEVDCLVGPRPNGTICGDSGDDCRLDICEDGTCVLSIARDGAVCASDDLCELGGYCSAGDCICFDVCACGDGLICGDEACDDGNDSNHDGCYDCSVTTFRVDEARPGAWVDPSVAINSSGAVFVAWEECDSWPTGPPEDECRSYARAFDADGEPTFDALSITAEIGPTWPSVVADNEGRFTIFWDRLTGGCEILSGDRCYYDIMAQRFAPDGSALDAPNVVATTYHRGSHGHPFKDAASNGEGSIALTWVGGIEDDDLNSYLYDIYVKRLSPDGTTSLETVRVNDADEAGASYPSVAINNSGDTLVSWQDLYDWPVLIQLQQFDGVGARVGGNQTIDSASNGLSTSFNPVGINDSGAAVLLWTVYCPDCATDGSDPFPIRYQTYSLEAGEMIGDSLMLHPGGEPHQLYPRVGIGDDGEFAAVWMDFYTSPARLNVQRFDPSGTSVGDWQCLGAGWFPAFAMAGDGRSVVVFKESQDGHIAAQRFTADGQPIGLLPW